MLPPMSRNCSNLLENTLNEHFRVVMSRRSGMSLAYGVGVDEIQGGRLT